MYKNLILLKDIYCLLIKIRDLIKKRKDFKLIYFLKKMESLNEGDYLKGLVKELKKFLMLSEDKKPELAHELGNNWKVEETNQEFSDRTKEIASNLNILNYYEEDPEGYTYLAKALLDESEEQLILISPEEEREESETEELDEKEKENEESEDVDYEEKFTIG